MSEAGKSPDTSSKDESGSPPQLIADLPSMKDVQATTKSPNDTHLPVDVLLLTVKDCEFLACYKQLHNPFKWYFDGLGYVFFEDMDKRQKEKVTIALMRCCEGSGGPGRSLITVKNAATVLRPKAVISVGICSGLNPQRTNLGDVVVSAKLKEQLTGMRSYVSRRFLDVIKHAGDGWVPPLKDPRAQEFRVHCDGEFLSGPEQVSSECRRKELADSHPNATAIEMEGEGLFTAAFDVQIEWLVVKGISNYADGNESMTEKWSSFASATAASVVTNILSDPIVFKQWPHYQDVLLASRQEAPVSSYPSSQASQQSFTTATEHADSSSREQSRWSKIKGFFKPSTNATFLKSSRKQLKSFYKNTMSQVMITPWNPDDTMDIDEVYVELSFLRDDRKLSGTKKEKLEDYTEIFEGRGHHLIPKRIIVYGKPGIGKSTFAKKLAVDWSRGEKKMLTKFEVLLLIKLSDVCNNQDIISMLREAELLSADDPTVFNKLYDYVLQNQQKVLLVLDGYDEYSGEKSSAVNRVWKGSQLRDCTVLVTTRLTKQEELRAPSHAQFEINGFNSMEQIEKFALKFLHHEEDVREFTEFLNKRGLWSLATIPLLLLMLCLTWKEKDHRGLLASRAHLYESFFQTLFDHLAAKNPDTACASVDEYKEDLSKLGKLAFDALTEDCLYFKLRKLPEDIRAVIEKFMSVGFFQISKLSSSVRPEQGVFFLHKTIQEFLSARFIVQELTSAKKGEVTCLSQIDSFEKVKKMVEVLKFVCELSSEAANAVLSHLRIIGEKEGLIECSLTETPSVEDMSYNQRVFRRISLDCLLCCPAIDRQDIFPRFVHCVNGVLVVDDDQLRLVAREHALKFSDLPELSYLFFNTLAFYKENLEHNVLSLLRDLETVLVTCYGDTTAEVENYKDLLSDDFFLKKEGGQMTLYLTHINKDITFQPLRFVEQLHALTSAPESPPQKPVDCVQNRKNSNETESKSGRTLNHSLSFVREITLYDPTSEELTTVNNALCFVNGPRVIFISNSGKSCNVQLIESFASRIPFTDNLHGLGLSNLNLTANSATDIFKLLYQAHNLHELNLSGNNLHSTVSDLAENLHHLPQLTQLNLSDVAMGDKECRLLAESLNFVRKLQVLNLSSNPLVLGIRELVKHLPCVPHLTELHLKETRMAEKEGTAFARCLSSISKLKSLDLSSNPLAGQGITELTKHLPCVPHLTKLNLERTQMGEKEGTAVACALKDLPELEWLELSHNPLGRGVSELSQHLSSIPQLRFLLLSDVKMTKKEASELCAALQGTNINICSDYHTIDHDTQVNRLYTEAELKVEERLYRLES